MHDVPDALELSVYRQPGGSVIFSDKLERTPAQVNFSRALPNMIGGLVVILLGSLLLPVAFKMKKQRGE